MKTIKTGFYLLLISVVFSLVFLVQTRTLVLPWQRQTQKAVYSTLMETGETSLLQSAEYRMKILFPYDFMEDGDKVDWQVLQWYYNNDPDQYQMNSSPSFYPDQVLPGQWKYASLYSLCRESGIDPANDGSFFIVISAAVRAGISFSSETMEIVPLTDESRAVPKVRLVLPSPEITDIIIEDRNVQNNDFPEVPMTPDQWSRFIKVLSPRFRDLAIREGILEMAAESATRLLRDLFEGAGFEIQTIDFSG